MTLREALESAGFVVRTTPRDYGEEHYVEHCGKPVSSEAWAGGIFGPARVWCEVCGAEVAQRNDPDHYGVESSGHPPLSEASGQPFDVRSRGRSEA